MKAQTEVVIKDCAKIKFTREIGKVSVYVTFVAPDFPQNFIQDRFESLLRN